MCPDVSASRADTTIHNQRETIRSHTISMFIFESWSAISWQQEQHVVSMHLHANAEL